MEVEQHGVDVAEDGEHSVQLGAIYVGVQINHPPADVALVSTTEMAVRETAKALPTAAILSVVTFMSAPLVPVLDGVFSDVRDVTNRRGDAASPSDVTGVVIDAQRRPRSTARRTAVRRVFTSSLVKMRLGVGAQGVDRHEPRRRDLRRPASPQPWW